MEPYYERRAAEYDEWYTGEGLFGARASRLGRGRPSAPARGRGAPAGPDRGRRVRGFLTRALRSDVIAVDASQAMLERSRSRHGHALVRADAFTLPFRDSAFDQVFTGHFYGHLYPGGGSASWARRSRGAIARDRRCQAARDGGARAGPTDPNDGSRHEVYKRYFTAAQLASELGGGNVLFDGRWFVAVETRR